MRWTGYVECMAGKRNVWSALVKDRERMKELWRYKCRRENISELDRKDTEEYGCDSFGNWWALV